MSEMNKSLDGARRLLLKARIEPVQGDRFQPTGFADIGAGTYELPDGTRMLLVESSQSMANRLEATIIDDRGNPLPELKDLPYIHVTLDSGKETFETTSLLEAHRINSPFIIQDAKFKESFMTMAGYQKGKPLDWPKIAKAVFHFDPNSLLHGIFLANLEDGRIKISRALSSFIEARNVREVVTGGVKNNPFDPTGKLRAKVFDKDVYSNVPYQRVEYTAETIIAYFNLDVGLLRSYALPQEAFNVLISLALLKIRRFLNGGLRLRTACDFRLIDDTLEAEPKGYALPAEESLASDLQNGLSQCGQLFANPPITRLTTQVVWKSKEKTETGEEVAVEEE